MPTRTNKAAPNRPSRASDRPAKRSAKAAPDRGKKTAAKSGSKRVRLLSGGNPQIAKADGGAVVQAYIEAMPGWKREVGRRLDELVTRTVPGVRKAVRWNSPFYGTEASGWFLSFHCITKYIKVAFFNGTGLQPPPPVESKQPKVRYLHIHEGEWADSRGELDEKQLAAWIRQASKLPGWVSFNC